VAHHVSDLPNRTLAPLFVGLVGALLVSSAPAQNPTETPADRPNVLFIAIDDLRTELNCYGASHMISPNIDRLAERGVLFERAYCAHPVCGPSRASLLTGLRPENLGVIDLFTHPRDVKPDIITLPQLFMLNGYTSHGIGKIFHADHQPNWKGDAASWSRPAEMAAEDTGSTGLPPRREWPPNLSTVARTENRDVPDNWYFDGQAADRAIIALNELKDEPFFLAVGFKKPHLPFQAPKKYWDMYDPATLPPVASPERPREAPEIAFHSSQELMREFPNGLTESDISVLRQGYYACTSYADAQVGRVVDELDRLDLADKTIIVLWSDHGFHLGEHGLWTKLSTFEYDLRVPMIIVDPRTTTAGSRAAAPVELLDLYPTLADLCGLEPPHPLDGVSLRPILQDPTVHVKPFAYSQTPVPHRFMPKGTELQAMGYSMRSPQYRYTEWRAAGSHEVLARELYDYTNTWLEKSNIANDPQNAALISSMAESLKVPFPVAQEVE
jgi:iduronate 2-sulfatase